MIEPMYEQIRPERLYEQIVEQIEASILTGDLSAGDQFPPERELAEQFGVSRTAVREAMKVLRQKGLAESQPGRGTFVTTHTATAVRHSLDLMFKIEMGDGLDNLVEVREILEPEIAARAALRRDEQDLEALQNAVQAAELMTEADTFIARDLDFHLTLATATKNTLLVAMMDAMMDLLHEQRQRTFFASGGARRGNYHHRRILDAIVRQDATAARDAMRAHLKQVRADTHVESDMED